jgi:hypothetical protein
VGFARRSSPPPWPASWRAGAGARPSWNNPRGSILGEESAPAGRHWTPRGAMRDTPMSSPAPPRPRSLLESAPPPPKTRSCGTQPANISLTAIVDAPPRRALLAHERRPAHAGLLAVPLDNRSLHIRCVTWARCAGAPRAPGRRRW